MSHHHGEARPYGFGSVHSVRDVGDAVKVLAALNTHEEDGQETCLDPVVIVGGGFLTMELAATIAKYRDDKVPVTVVLSQDRLLPALFGKAPTSEESKATADAGEEDPLAKAKEADGVPGARDIAEFYERQLVKIRAGKG